VTRQLPVIIRRLLSKADEDLQLANLVLKASTDHAAKFAYMAAFHAAQAALADITGDAPKTHKGMRSMFAKLASETEGFGKDMGRFLAQAYQSKEKADYKLEVAMEPEKAQAMLTEATEFVARVKRALAAR
jgi:uncharacterized protein (UPF0332 family)